MIFQNPWGLLAFLSLPVIVGLHFFRSRRRVQRIGGLHLWQFARVRMPVGRRWQRLQSNLPLFFQLVGAALLSFLIAGVAFPSERTRHHYTIILDDSASMTGGDDESAAKRARDDLRTWAGANDRFTVVAAGERAHLVAGPFATREELLEGLASWRPEAPRCDLTRGVELATKFLTEGASQVLFVTDEPLAAPQSGLVVHAVGDSLDNVAIDFADRAPDGPERDRIHAVVRLYGTLARKSTLRISAEGQVLTERSLDLEPGVPLSISFQTERLGSTLDLELPDDTLAIDNTAHLAPLERKVVAVAGSGLGAGEKPLSRAVGAVPGARIVAATDDADLVFTTVPDYEPSGRQVRTCILPPPDAEPDVGVEGRDIVAVPGHPATDALPTEGLVWAARSDFPSGDRELLYYRDTALLSMGRESAGRGVYHLNLVASRSNVFRQTAWPVLVQGLIEETREAMPGMGRTNLRAGQDVTMRLPVRLDLDERFELQRDGKQVETWSEAPRALPPLAPGLYTVIQAGRETLARFAVNFFSPGESDLRPRATRRADLGELVSQTIDKGESSRIVYFALLVGILISMALAWIFQDSSR